MTPDGYSLKIIMRGRRVVGGKAQGHALVSRAPLMGWGCLDHKRGIITERGHPLYEIPFKGKVLIFPEPRGSGGFNSFGHTTIYGVSPAAFIFTRSISLTVLAAMQMRRPALTDFDADPVQAVETGDWVEVDADAGILAVYKQD